MQERVEERLRQAGVRLTGPRRAIVTALATSDRALTLQEIRLEARAVHPSLSVASTYRAIELLQRHGLVQRLHREAPGCQRFFLSLPGHRHPLICVECGCVIEFPGGENIEGLERQLEDRTGFEIEDHLLQVYGRCPSHRLRRGREETR